MTRLSRILLILNILLMGTALGFLIYGRTPSNIEARSIVLKGPDGTVAIEMVASDEGGILAFKNAEGIVRFQMQGGDHPALLLRGAQNQLVSSLFTLSDGGAAFGLGDAMGNVSMLTKGGTQPSLAFYQQSTDPGLSLGMAKGVPHVILANRGNPEKVVVHGGDPASLIFINENGDMPIIISKHGVNQNKDKTVLYGPSKIKQSLEELSFVK